MSMNSIRRTPVSSNGSRLSKKTETAQQRPHLYKWSGQQNTMPRRQTKRHAFMALLKARGIKLCAMISAASYPQSRALEVSRSPDWLLDERHARAALLSRSCQILSSQSPLRRYAAWLLISALIAWGGGLALQQREVLCGGDDFSVLGRDYWTMPACVCSHAIAKRS
ncbi:uncharacterized protein CC84DRAFT_1181148 [Paraphaeosphaeria sporulosa]|uniref:Uncharacterized protein n=1 Tax=Paraphaeosphaeria sporulosa TaxID=1460663 RepID=A0A177BXI4_9PLEO|nr:uncharacterized protein CC84DRAFT_1181148 [Paraphaeosphaeria sporulosa]OAF99670.1 hypothetical protein CC84DRAFT_1181148 [Paraphaeosphaeria sporulosa]